MPLHNAFQHQVYPTAPVCQPLLRTLECVEPGDSAYSSLHSALQIGRVILVHGTFMGEDPLALSETLNALAEESPLVSGPLVKLALYLREKTPALMASAAKDIGNYTPEYRNQFQALVGDYPQVELLHPKWSSQNHHLARAELAVLLLSQLLQRPLPPDQRVLLWGHSHAGNAFALLTNLLANDRHTVTQFFDAVGDQPGPQWKLVELALKNAASPHPFGKSLVFVTFGTPVRYGWDVSGCSGLVHVTHHRPHDALHPFVTKPLFPPLMPQDIVNATFGDWVQAFAIAGTDVRSFASRTTNQALTDLLERNLPEPRHGLDTRLITPAWLRDTCARWKHGTRCHSDGLNVLAEYHPSGEKTVIGTPLEYSLLGHGVATTTKWLPAHLKLVIEALKMQQEDGWRG